MDINTINNVDLIPIESLYQIMLELNIKDLSSLCLSNKSFMSICKDPYFWVKKLEHDKVIDLIIPKEGITVKYLDSNYYMIPTFKVELLDNKIKITRYIGTLDLFVSAYRRRNQLLDIFRRYLNGGMIVIDPNEVLDEAKVDYLLRKGSITKSQRY